MSQATVEDLSFYLESVVLLVLVWCLKQNEDQGWATTLVDMLFIKCLVSNFAMLMLPMRYIMIPIEVKYDLHLH